MKKGKKTLTGIALILLLCGIALLLYPKIRQNIYQQQANRTIENFRNDVLRRQSAYEAQEDPLSNLYIRIQRYNEALFQTGQSGLVDPFSYEEPSFDLSEFGLEENIIGYIEIPKIDVRLPIYLGASRENMMKGAAHLSKTSLPVGGKNTNCVIAAHRGSRVGLMFRNIHKLKAGDEIYIVNLWETLTYRVTGSEIILPDDIEKIMIRSDEDMITLSSCHPLGGYSSQRYIVYATRTPLSYS